MRFLQELEINLPDYETNNKCNQEKILDSEEHLEFYNLLSIVQQKSGKFKCYILVTISLQKY